ncbi:MAG: class I SAM-dependent methyltransferase [Epsilonproteobacteria bacterium]|nr:MAG: class I SAM-dependent methyltransferase [Campylobacterota bacterium]
MANTSVNSLDLYSKVEDLLGVQEVTPKLYAHYLLFLNNISFDTLLDVGCGSGNFLLQMQKSLSIAEAKGIDLSPLMIEKTLEKDIDAQCINLCSLEGRYEVITAVFDMLNYLDKNALKHFLLCVRERLNDGGIFLCDLNTLYGFENVAVGSYIVDDNKRFLTVDSDFENSVYNSEFTLFEKEGGVFKKSQERIKQYYHKVEEIVKLSGLELIEQSEIFLYDFDEADKVFVVLKKV